MKKVTKKVTKKVKAEKLNIAVKNGTINIVILPQGWVAVGNYYRDKENCMLTNARIVRVWGTAKGLGEIAALGPTEKTILDASGTMRFDALLPISIIECNAAKWQFIYNEDICKA